MLWYPRRLRQITSCKIIIIVYGNANIIYSKVIIHHTTVITVLKIYVVTNNEIPRCIP